MKSLLELESGSNDPMAVFLTVALIGLLGQEANAFTLLIQMFLLQMVLGAVVGFALGWTLVWLLRTTLAWRPKVFTQY